jgi:hypothetical protein
MDPQELPLQPLPVTLQVSAEFGLELGIGVSVATTATELPIPVLVGAASCNKKLLVMFNAADAVLEGSATLCAFTTTAAEKGKMDGAV